MDAGDYRSDSRLCVTRSRRVPLWCRRRAQWRRGGVIRAQWRRRRATSSTSRIMSGVRRTGTRPELALRRALRAEGLRGYRVDARGLPGRPDIAFTRIRLAVFVDGAFWHGHPSKFQLGIAGRYWDEKIRGNQLRD